MAGDPTSLARMCSERRPPTSYGHNRAETVSVTSANGRPERDGLPSPKARETSKSGLRGRGRRGGRRGRGRRGGGGLVGPRLVLGLGELAVLVGVEGRERGDHRGDGGDLGLVEAGVLVLVEGHE